MKDKITLEDVEMAWKKQLEAAERLDALAHLDMRGKPQRRYEQALVEASQLTKAAEVLQKAYYDQIDACPHVTTEWVETGGRFASYGEADDNLEWRLVCLDCGEDITPEKQVDDEIPF